MAENCNLAELFYQKSVFVNVSLSHCASHYQATLLGIGMNMPNKTT